MSVVILHYHLHPGGVRRVIESQIKAFLKCGYKNIKVITSSPNLNNISNIPITSCEYLNYLPPNISKEECRAIYAHIKNFLHSFLRNDDILHVHNLNLGKNPVLTLVVYEIAQEGIKVFNHCHDFAEDGREENYRFLYKIICEYFGKDLRNVMYPNLPNYFFGVLNSKDKQFLLEQNIPERRIRYIPNPIDEIQKDYSLSKEELVKDIGIKKELPIFIYPVRVIRRKNIGEYILFATIFSEKANWLVTLPPTNPMEISYYKRWKDFSKKIGANIYFEVGQRYSFSALMSRADRVITTSIKEGFGMAFLEPWLFDKPVVGRNIPYVVSDFIREGIYFPSLYEELVVVYKNKKIDFSLLSMEAQMQVIEEMVTNKELKEKFIEFTRIDDKIFSNIPLNVIYENKRKILEIYSVKKYGERLLNIYKEMLRPINTSNSYSHRNF